MKIMKKIFTGIAIAVALSASSSVFADSSAKLSAFNGVPSEAVSQTELNVVSGEGLVTLLPKIIKPTPAPKPIPGIIKPKYPTPIPLVIKYK
ncbi:MAG: hypothetical protein WCI06_07700 [Methylococcaceae bacterium]